MRDYPGKVEFTCGYCGKGFRRYENNRDANKFCTQGCHWASMRRWRVGTDGYKRQTFLGRDVRQHRVIAESALGRPLKSNEIVHHINGDKSDNRNQNLLICERGYHRKLHEKMSLLYAKEHFRS